MKRAALLAGLTFVTLTTVRATQPVTHVEQAADLARGSASGMVVSGRGALYRGPALEAYGAAFPGPAPAQVWSVVADDAGNVYVGTAPDGRIYKIDPRGETTLFFVADETMVTAMALTRQGDLLAAGAPGGVIYRVGKDGRGEVWRETDELYVWTLVPAAADRFYAGTGPRGRILEIGPGGGLDLLFDSDESHIVALATIAGGGLLAGGAGRGLIYRIDSEGHAMVLHDGELAEVAALIAQGGAVVAALLDPPAPEVRRPVLRIRLPGRPEVGASPDATADVLEDDGGPTIEGTIEGIPASGEPERVRVRGRVIRIDAAGETSEIWSSRLEAPFGLLADGDGGVYFGTGEPGRIFRVDRDGRANLLATLDEAQVTRILSVPRGILLTTGNPARVYRLGRSAAEPGEFLSSPVDAGGPARWGTIRWSPVGAEKTEFYTRTGNSRRPDATWSAWSPAMVDGSGSPIVNPDGRFLQWRMRQTASGGTGVPVSDVGLTYEPYNRSPSLRGFQVSPSARWVRGTVEFRWEAADPDGDPVRVSVEFRARGAADWRLAGVTETTGGNGAMTWDTGEIAEGEYEVRATGSDQPANPLGEGHVVESDATILVTIDRTPPLIESRAIDPVTIEVRVKDARSTLKPVELIRDGEVRFRARPEDGVCDSRDEVYRVVLPSGSGGGWSARGTDAAGNVVEHALSPAGEAD